uniref:Uncharacterized protein n=1 Tax=Cacopsylla melanoneura TaxID=428564 RepID=A0A8D9AZV3_9HEMI
MYFSGTLVHFSTFKSLKVFIYDLGMFVEKTVTWSHLNCNGCKEFLLRWKKKYRWLHNWDVSYCLLFTPHRPDCIFANRFFNFLVLLVFRRLFVLSLLVNS